MKKKVTLVNCIFRTEKISYPINVYYLKYYLNKAGYDVQVKDYQLVKEKRYDPSSLINFLKDSYQAVCFSVLSNFLPFLILAIQREPEFFSNKTIILGGIGVYGIEKSLLEQFPQIDFILRGEGEEKLKLLLDTINGNRLDTIRKVNDIFFRIDNKVLHGSGYQPVFKSDFGFTANVRTPLIENRGEYNSFNVQFSRGCPYGCTFCGMTSYWGEKYRCRNLDSFINEILILNQEYNVNKIGIIDNIYTYDREILSEFCKRIIELDLRIYWGCYSRVNCISEDLLEKMARAGCKKLFFGVESGSDDVLKKMNKGITQAEIVKTAKKALNYIDIVSTSFIWGFPYETLEDLKETTTLLIYLSFLGASPKLSLLTPYPYTHIARLYNDSLVFQKEVSTEFLYYNSQDDVKEHISKVILEHKDICSAFYYIDHESFWKKNAYLDIVHLGNKDFFEAWEKAKPDQSEIEI